MNSPSSPVALSTKIYYGFGAVALAAKDNGFNYFLLMFYSQVMGLSPSLASLALFISLCFDAVSDPLVGYFSDNFHSSWGRRHPFMYASVLPMVVGYYFLWNPPAEMSQAGMFAYLITLSVTVRTLVTLYQIPSDAMGAELTSDYDERTSLISYRFLFSWACSISLAFVVYKVYLVDTPEYPDGILNPAGWGKYGITGAILIAVGILVSAIGTHKHIPFLKSPPPKEPFSLVKTGQYLRKTLTNKSFLALFVSSLLFSVAFGVSMTLNIYWSRYYWQLSQDQLWLFSPVNLVAAAAALFLAPRLSAHIDKQTVAIRLWVFAALFLPVPVLLRLVGWFPPAGSDPLLYLLLVHSFTEILVITIASILIASMMADLVEDSEKDTGRRSEGLYFSSLSFSSKAVTGLGVVIAGLILEFVNFPVGASFGEVAERTMTKFALISVFTMVGFYLLATYFMTFYRITRARHSKNLTIIEAAAIESSSMLGEHDLVGEEAIALQLRKD